ncbi:PAS domain S-box-containing protein [Chthoniobacter flavus]|nr:PAS domain S-box-containing protein [Chthoniobacter flavus]
MAMSSFAQHLPTFHRFRRWWSKEDGLASRHVGSSVLAVGVILVLAIVFLTLAIREHATDTARTTEYAILQAATGAENDFAAVEISLRSYLLTGQSLHLEQFERRRVAFQAHLIELMPLLQSKAPRRESIRFIGAEFQNWLQNAARPEIAQRKQGHEGTTLMARGLDSSRFDQIRAELGRFVRASNAELEALNDATRWRRLLQTCGFALLSALAVSFLVTSSYQNYRAFRRHLRKAEEATAQNRAIIDNTLDGVITVDENGMIQSLNPAAERMFVQEAKSVIGQNVSLLIPQRLFFHDMKNVKRGAIMAVGQRQGYYPFPIEISLSSMEFAGRRQYVAIVRDVGERQKSEETLRQISLGVSQSTGEEFLRSLLKQLSKALPTDYAFLVELSGKGAGQFSTLALAEQGNIRRNGQCALANSAFADAISRGFRAHLGGARVLFPEDVLLQELAIESFIAAPLMDHRAQTVGLIGVLDRKQLGDTQATESTLQIFAGRAAAEIERKRSEEDLAAEKERLAVTMRSMADGFITIDTSGSVLMLNPVAESLSGWTQDDAAGKPLATVFQIFNERNRKRYTLAIQRIVEAGIAEGLDGPALLIARDGSERLVESNAAPIRDRSGGRVGAVVVFRDVTEKRRLDEERQKADKLESLGVVAGGIAHDFNNLLTAILGNISLALLCAPEPQVGERLGAAKRATSRAQELAQQLLTFAKGGAPVKQTASMSQLLRDTLSLTLHGSKAHIEFHVADDLWPVDIDPGQMSQVINNLAMNADQAMPAGGVLRVQAENVDLVTHSVSLGLDAGRWVKISLQDQGIGIPEEYLKKIFDPYFTTKPKGSGLGLATAYSIVKNHHGVIAVDSKPGEGSTFTICLPASEHELQVQDTSPVPMAPTGSARVLVLDDEEAICMLVTCALEERGYKVTETNDGTQAIAAYEKAMQEGKPYDLFISDLTIPGGMGGQETIKRLLEIDPDIRAIVSSGYANDPVMSRYEEYGFSGMIAKPYEIDALGRKVAEILAQPRRRVIFHRFERKTA